MQNDDETLNAEVEQTEEEVSENEASAYVDIEVRLPTGNSIEINGVVSNESLSSIKLNLIDFQETAFYSSYRLQLRESIDAEGNKFEMPVDSNEFVELAVYLTPNIKKCVMDVVYEDYDVKKVRTQVKRTREAIAFPPQSRSFTATEVAQPVVQVKAPLSEKAIQNQLKEKIRNALPKSDSFLDPLDLGSFYQETLLRTGKIIETPGKALSDVVKSITVSGWNPPPPARKMQGDLLYLEVATASEGTFHLTANARGFYVNKSNRNHFDPLPVANAHHSHELFSTLLGVSAALRNAWAAVTSFAPTFKGEEGALDAIATLYSQGRGDQSTATLQWNTLPNNTFGAEHNQAHTYDLFRAQEDAASLFGIEELGAQREWNDEIQALRTVTASDINEKSMVAKLEYKIISEFTEACKAAAVAISEGHITPISYTDPVQSDIYVYNGIFFSKAEDTKDAFRICNGDEAFRKATGRDLQNQKRIQALGKWTARLCLLVGVCGMCDDMTSIRLILPILCTSVHTTTILNE
jgi:protein TIF31